MKARELRELTVEELEAKSRELRGELFNVKIKRATGQLENTAKLGTLRREIARVETILREQGGVTTE
jgi:large subunit ribosomal protein L29